MHTLIDEETNTIHLRDVKQSSVRAYTGGLKPSSVDLSSRIFRFITRLTDRCRYTSSTLCLVWGLGTPFRWRRAAIRRWKRKIISAVRRVYRVRPGVGKGLLARPAPGRGISD